MNVHVVTAVEIDFAQFNPIKCIPCTEYAYYQWDIILFPLLISLNFDRKRILNTAKHDSKVKLESRICFS